MSDPAHPAADEAQTLRYRMPDHQDPAVVLSVLANADYRAGLEEVDGRFYVVITCPRGRASDREAIRATIARDADKASLEGPSFARSVVFEDEA